MNLEEKFNILLVDFDEIKKSVENRGDNLSEKVALEIGLDSFQDNKRSRMDRLEERLNRLEDAMYNHIDKLVDQLNEMDKQLKTIKKIMGESMKEIEDLKRKS